MMEQEEAGDYEAAYATTVEAAGIGERFGDADLVALARFDQGRLLATQGRIEEGLARLDEAMVAVSTGELSPIVTGLLYCSVIARLPAGVRAAPGPRVDRRPVALVRGAARDGQLHRLVPRPSRRDHAGGRCVAGGAGRDAACPAAVRAGAEPAGDRRGPLPPGRDPPAARRTRGGRGGVPRSEPMRSGAPARSGPAATRRKATTTRRPPRSGGWWARPQTR